MRVVLELVVALAALSPLLEAQETTSFTHSEFGFRIAIPADWKTQDAKTAAGQEIQFGPGGDATVQLGVRKYPVSQLTSEAAGRTSAVASMTRMLGRVWLATCPTDSPVMRARAPSCSATRLATRFIMRR